jgi:metallo-beta-lactamase family protein
MLTKLTQSPSKQSVASLLDQILAISERSSIGYHTLALMRFEPRQTMIFTESYPELEVRANGKSAMSLQEIGEAGGPHLEAIEFNLKIFSAQSIAQVRDLRRARAMIPELKEARITDDAVTLIYPRVSRDTYYRDKEAVKKLFKESFAGKRIIFIEDHSIRDPEIELTKQQLNLIRKIFQAAWSNSKTNWAKHIQAITLDQVTGDLTFIEQGPVSSASEKASFNKSLDLNLRRTRHHGQIWQDSVRAALFNVNNLPEALRIHAIAHELFITSLCRPRSEWLLKQSTKGLPFEVRARNIDDSCLEDRLLFDLLPNDWNFRGTRLSACGEKILVDADPPRLDSNADEITKALEAELKIAVFLPTTRFKSIGFESSLARRVMTHVPFGAVTTAIEECQVSGDIRLTTVNAISDSTRAAIRDNLGVSVYNSSNSIHVPHVIKEPVALIASNAMSPVDLNIKGSEIRKLKIHGGSGIGGSALTFGPILLDCGALFFDQNEQKDSLDELLRSGSIMAAFITHSHLDHVGAAFPLDARNLPVFMHYGTAIASWQILQEQTRINPSFTKYALSKLYSNVQPLPYGYPLKLSEEVSVTLAEAGHVTGSSMVILNYTGKDGAWRAGYTSDLQGNEHGAHLRIYPPAARTEPLDALIIEATNGMEPIKPRVEIERILIDTINEALSRGGQVLLPTLATKGPELLTLLLHNRDQIEAPIYIDGSALMNVNEVSDYLASICPDLFVARPWQSQGWHGINTGAFKEISRTSTREFFRSRERRLVVMSGGMGQGSAEKHIDNAKPEDTVIFTSYQAPGTLGSILLEKERAFSSNSAALTRESPRALQIRLSGHITGVQILNFVEECLKPGGTIILTHGSQRNKLNVKAALTQQGIAGKIIIAENGLSYDLR